MKWPTLSNHGKALLILSLLQALAVVAVEIVISVYFIQSVNVSENSPAYGSGKSITVYLFIYIFTQIYQFVIIVDAIWGQNTIQVFAHVIFCGAMVGFSIFQLFQIKEALNNLYTTFSDTKYLDLFTFLLPFLIASIIVLAICFICFIYLSFKLYLEFGWKIYKKIGADPKKREMYRSYQILIMLLKFALYFFVAYAIQFLVLVLQPADSEFGLTIFLILISPVVVYLVAFGLKRENKIILGFWLFLLILIEAYFAFKIGRIYDPTQTQKYIGSSKFLTLFASLGFVVMTITFAYSVICVLNFGKGLKEHLTNPPTSSSGNLTEQRGNTGTKRTMVLA